MSPALTTRLRQILSCALRAGRWEVARPQRPGRVCAPLKCSAAAACSTARLTVVARELRRDEQAFTAYREEQYFHPVREIQRWALTQRV